jgi:hypothetical protein
LCSRCDVIVIKVFNWGNIFFDTQESQVTKGGLTVYKRFVLLEVTNNFSSIPCIPRSLPQPVNVQTLVAGLHDAPRSWKFKNRWFIKFPFFLLFKSNSLSIPCNLIISLASWPNFVYIQTILACLHDVPGTVKREIESHFQAFKSVFSWIELGQIELIRRQRKKSVDMWKLLIVWIYSWVEGSTHLSFTE